MKILGIITARGGSRGIPGKNIKLLAGKPLIAYTIDAARSSGVLDRVILSTDDPAIAEVAKKYGCDAPFGEPVELAQDHSSHREVLRYAVQWLKEHEGYEADAAMLLQPTAPLRTAAHIKEAVERFSKERADSLVSVCEVPGHYNPHWQLKVTPEGRLEIFTTGGALTGLTPRRQELPKTYTRNGAVYLFRTELLFSPAGPDLYGLRTLAYIMDRESSVNIDTMEDWAEAERILAMRKEETGKL